MPDSRRSPTPCAAPTAQANSALEPALNVDEPRVIAAGSEWANEQSLSVSLGVASGDEWWEIAGRLELELELEVIQSP